MSRPAVVPPWGRDATGMAPDQLAPADRETLGRVPIFRALEDDVLDSMLREARVLECPAGRLLFRREDSSDHFFVVLSGWVKIFRETSDGEEAVLGIFTAGESLAEAAAFLGDVYPASAEVVEDGRVLRIPTRAFLAEVEKRPAVALNMLGSMSQHLHRLVQDVEQLQTRSATRRVVDFLLRQCRQSDGAAEVALPYDKTLLARRLGMQPESLSRIWARLRQYGVQTEQHRVMIRDVDALKRGTAGLR